MQNSWRWVQGLVFRDFYNKRTSGLSTCLGVKLVFSYFLKMYRSSQRMSTYIPKLNQRWPEIQAPQVFNILIKETNQTSNVASLRYGEAPCVIFKFEILFQVQVLWSLDCVWENKVHYDRLSYNTSLHPIQEPRSPTEIFISIVEGKDGASISRWEFQIKTSFLQLFKTWGERRWMAYLSLLSLWGVSHLCQNSSTSFHAMFYVPVDRNSLG